MTQDFDWRTQTARRGTVFRVGQIVRGECPCGREDVLLYDADHDETLLCTDCSAKRAKVNPRVETCDDCGAEYAWRDPLAKANVFHCAECHAKNGTVFQNRWAPASRVLGQHKAVCSLANYGTDCKGEIKWRSLLKAEACNKHAGKTSSGPEHHQ